MPEGETTVKQSSGEWECLTCEAWKLGQHGHHPVQDLGTR